MKRYLIMYLLPLCMHAFEYTLVQDEYIFLHPDPEGELHTGVNGSTTLKLHIVEYKDGNIP